MQPKISPELIRRKAISLGNDLVKPAMATPKIPKQFHRSSLRQRTGLAMF